MSMEEFSKVHQCDKSTGKEPCVTINKEGRTYCAYCNEEIDWRSLRNYLNTKAFERVER
jgi:hypothetical protein